MGFSLLEGMSSANPGGQGAITYYCQFITNLLERPPRRVAFLLYTGSGGISVTDWASL